MVKRYDKQVVIGLGLIFILVSFLQGCGGSNEVVSVTPIDNFVSFHSDATNLVPDDTNGWRDVFVYNSRTGEIIRVNVSSSGEQAVGGDSEYPSMSADGRYIAFRSTATNLVADDTNGWRDIFRHDRRTGETIRVNVASNGDQAIDGGSDKPSISADGRYVAFHSKATNLVAGDTNERTDVFVHDCQTGETVRVSVASNGDEALSAAGATASEVGQEMSGGNSDLATISANGRYVAFQSDSTNLVAGDTNDLKDIFVHDRLTGQTTRVNVATNGDQALGGDSGRPTISADGRYVAFESKATNLVAGDTNDLRDIFVHDRQTGQTIRVSVSSNGDQATGGINEYPTMSSDGNYVAWQSDATNLVADDTNSLRDIFVRDIGAGQTTRVNLSSEGDQALGGGSYDPSY